MTVSSRTPEGLPSRCVLCGAENSLEFSETGEDAPCPACGQLLWHSEMWLVLITDILARHFGVERDQITADTELNSDLGASSLDVVELVMELEEELDLNLTDEEAARIKTIGDLVAYLSRLRGPYDKNF